MTKRLPPTPEYEIGEHVRLWRDPPLAGRVTKAWPVPIGVQYVVRVELHGMEPEFAATVDDLTPWCPWCCRPVRHDCPLTPPVPPAVVLTLLTPSGEYRYVRSPDGHPQPTGEVQC